MVHIGFARIRVALQVSRELRCPLQTGSVSVGVKILATSIQEVPPSQELWFVFFSHERPEKINRKNIELKNHR